MQKKLYGIIAASILIASSGQAKSLTEQRKNQLEQDVLVVQHSLKELRIKIAELTSLATKVEPTLQVDALKACQEEISRMIDEIALQFDASRPEPNALKLLLELFSVGTYQRPTGSLTPQAFRELDLWLHDLTDTEVRQALVIVKEKIKDNRASHINKLYNVQGFTLEQLNEMPKYLNNLAITQEEIEQFRALKIIKAQIWFELDKREEDEE